MKRRDVEKLADEEVAYWHASQWSLPVGQVIRSRGSTAKLTPSLVDVVRPEGVPKRDDHLFMVRDPKCFEVLGQALGNNFVYRVPPVEPVRRANFRWIEDVYGVAADDPDYKSNPKAVRAAKNYWSGKRHPKGACEDEYLTMAFRVEPR
jgi:hypothetical protein